MLATHDPKAGLLAVTTAGKVINNAHFIGALTENAP